MTARIVCIFIAVSVTGMVLSSCFKDLPKKYIVLNEDFSSGKGKFSIYDNSGLLDSAKLFPFNGSVVFGPFNNNRIEYDLEALPEHNLLRIQFDLYVHDKWEGNHLDPVTGIPDVWLMSLDHNPAYLTTFSTNPNQAQSFPANYLATYSANANAWGRLPGRCALAEQPDGTTLYKMDFMTGHTNSKLHIDWSDAIQPAFQLCQKSWSIDNIVITVSTY